MVAKSKQVSASARLGTARSGMGREVTPRDLIADAVEGSVIADLA